MAEGGADGQACRPWIGHPCPPPMSIFCGLVDMTASTCRSDRHEGRHVSTKYDFDDISPLTCRWRRHISAHVSPNQEFGDMLPLTCRPGRHVELDVSA